MANPIREKKTISAIKSAFGEKLNANQISALIRFASYCGTYARNGAAMDNLIRRSFEGVQISYRDMKNWKGETFKGRVITVDSVQEDEQEGDE